MNKIRLGGARVIVSFISFYLLMLILFPISASSAELRGQIWDAATGAAPANGSLHLSCGGKPNPHPLVGNGSYSIRNVPNGSCKLTVSTSRGTATRTISINKPVVQFNCETRRAGNKIVLVPR